MNRAKGRETGIYQEGPDVNDRAVELLEQYDVEVIRTRKGRGAIVCDTDKGCLIFKEYAGTDDKILIQNRLLEQIAESETIQAERIIPAKEGALTVRDGDGVRYVLKTWRESRECNVHDRTECRLAVELLARLHRVMELPADTPGMPLPFSPEMEYEKHNRELKRVRKYLQQKGQKTEFEIRLLQVFDFFLEQAQTVTQEWKAYGRSLEQGDLPRREKTVSFCHGDYQYHNLLKESEGWFLVNFEKCLRDSPVRDVYLLLRKLLEKGGWSVSLGTELLEAYEKESPLSVFSRIDLYYRLSYPEKFWKIVNFYYNSGKAWIPGKNHEKLEKLIAQETEKQRFLEEAFRDVSRMRRA